MASLDGANALVLGGLGFIGSNLALRLLELGARVTVVDALLPQYGGNLANIEPARGRLEVLRFDIRDQARLGDSVRGQDVIYSVAGQTSHIESMTDPLADLDINCRSQLSILECCRAGNPGALIVYASTRQLYGRPQYLPVDEKHPTAPVDVNGINKLAAEMYYTLYYQVHGIKSVSLRLTNSYGPRQHVSGNKQGFAGIFLRKAISGERIQIFGDGRQRRDFNYIDDVVDAFIAATVEPRLYGGAFNLGADAYYSLLDFVTLLQQLCAFEFELIPFPPEHKAIDIGDYYSDYGLFHRLTGWRPRVDLEPGLRATVDYFKPRQRLYW